MPCNGTYRKNPKTGKYEGCPMGSKSYKDGPSHK